MVGVKVVVGLSSVKVQREPNNLIEGRNTGRGSLDKSCVDNLSGTTLYLD